MDMHSGETLGLCRTLSSQMQTHAVGRASAPTLAVLLFDVLAFWDIVLAMSYENLRRLWPR